MQSAVRQSFKAEAEGRLSDSLRAVNGDLAAHLARHPIVRYRSGKVLLKQRKWREAAVALSEAALGDPQQPGLFSHCAFVLRMLGDVTGARRSLRAAR